MIEKLGNGLPADFVPVLKHFPDKKTKEFIVFMNEFHDAVGKEVKAHRDAYDPGTFLSNMCRHC